MPKKFITFLLRFAGVMVVFAALEGVLRVFQPVLAEGQLARPLFWIRIAWVTTFALFLWRGFIGCRNGDLLIDD